LLFSFVLECAIGKVYKNGLELNGTHQLQVYAVDVELLGKNITTINEADSVRCW
jgi:hypothetical protein